MVFTTFLTFLAGSIVGISLGLLGGGGSILAIPLLVYLVGITDPHVAIGTSALCVSATAIAGLVTHARAGHVAWRATIPFAAVGAMAAFGGATLATHVDGKPLLIGFGLFMLVAAAGILRRSIRSPQLSQHHPAAWQAPVSAAGVGLASGFFGIGGGFLVAPALMSFVGLAPLMAIGSSLLVVATFGLTVAVRYSISGLVNWPITAVFVVGGSSGVVLGKQFGLILSTRDGMLQRVLGVTIAVVALFIISHEAGLFR